MGRTGPCAWEIERSKIGVEQILGNENIVEVQLRKDIFIKSLSSSTVNFSYEWQDEVTSMYGKVVPMHLIHKNTPDMPWYFSKSEMKM
jgi:hypothetical protein